MVARSGGNRFLPPLPRHLIGEQFLVGLGADAAGRKKDHAGRGVTVGRAGFGFDNSHVGVRREAEHAGEIRHQRSYGLAFGLRHGGFGTAEIQAGGDALGLHLGGLILHHGDAAGKRRPGVLDVVDILIAIHPMGIQAAA